MNVRKIKRIVTLLASLGLILIFLGTFPNVSISDFSLYEFARGVLLGMGIVATVVWLISLVTLIIRTDKSEGVITSVLQNKMILLSMLMFLLMVGTEVTVYLSGNQILLTAGIIVTGVSIFLNTFYLKKTGCGKLLDA